MVNVLWFEGSFVETLKGWHGWFYITEPRDPKWTAAPEFRSGPPTRLMSWKEMGLSWGDEKEVTGLQTCIQSLVNKPIQLVNVIQVMLVRRILRANNGILICGSSTRLSIEPSTGFSTRRTKTPGRCYSRAPRLPHPLPRTANTARSVTLAR